MAQSAGDVIVVRGNGGLDGEVCIGGAKNSVLKLIAACLLAEGQHVLANVPDISDVSVMCELLEAMGVSITRTDHCLVIDVPAEINTEAPYHLVERMRASIVVLGPLLARFGAARVALPGGDDFGPRPIDMHLRALESLGATFRTSHGDISGTAEALTGAEIVLEYPSVGATENVLMAAVRAKGRTRIVNPAREPEIGDLVSFLNQMGAKARWAGNGLAIEGVEQLSPAGQHASSPRSTAGGIGTSARTEVGGTPADGDGYRVISDRIETATYLAAVGMCGGSVFLRHAVGDHMTMLIRKLTEMGMHIVADAEGIRATATQRLTSADVATLPYPGLATDYKPFLVAMLTTASGVGIVTENIFTGRFRYIDELRRMGADIRTEGHHAVVRGAERLSGAPVRAHDIRAGAALVVAGLAAEGETEVAGATHIDRGYDDLTGKLAGLGAIITRR
ncbi:UDP-N-acetylglucosamine 1-carboxyvinyltransferase [Candidatus Poriferisodalis sp.]|uniref:UDP-N-acetylglucosamine 1-carboxyvinyltransferase n=1 Tax=Candidatus Poriferisodalis sp. TaxID=3101277 RepID=UPI003B02DD76